MFSNIKTRNSVVPPPNDNLGVLEVGHVRVPKGNYFPQFTTYFCAVAWCIEGGLELVGNDWTRTAYKNDLILVDYGETFETKGLEAENEVCYIFYDGAHSSDLLTNHGLWSDVFAYSHAPIDFVYKIMDEFDNPDRQEWVVSISYALLHQTINDMLESSSDKLMFNICRFIHKNSSDVELNVSMILDHFGVKRTKTSCDFKDYTGVNMLDYIVSVRMKKAIKLIKCGCYSIKDVASMVGFSDARYFATRFKKEFGRSPRDLLK